MEQRKEEARKRRTRNLVQIGAVTVSVLGEITDEGLPEYKKWLRWALAKWVDEQVRGI